MLNNTDYGLILIVLIALYFVIKTAVKNGINQSMLFSEDDRRKNLEQLKKNEQDKQNGDIDNKE